MPKSRRNYHCPRLPVPLRMGKLQQRKFMTTETILAEPATLALGGLGIAVIVLIIIAVIVVIIIASMVGIYNKLVTMRNRYNNAYAQIDVQLKRRYDLIPNLVETAKGYMAHAVSYTHL